MMKPEKKKKKGGISLITGLVVGGAIGSVASLMFAPAKGSKTRKKALETGKTILKEGSTKAEEFMRKYNDRIKNTTKEK